MKGIELAKGPLLISYTYIHHLAVELVRLGVQMLLATNLGLFGRFKSPYVF